MKFITFEGCDFSGKSTQIKLLKLFFEQQGKKLFVTREPGGSKLSEQIRNLILSDNINDPLTEYLLLAAARKDHVDNVIKKNIKNNHYVISDRFYDSSICYQGYYKKLDINLIETIKQITIGDFQPDLTFLIDVSLNEIKKRILENNRDVNFYDSKNMDFYKTIKEGYLKIAQENKDRIIVIDGNKSTDEIHKEIITVLTKKIL
ncbi:MAG: dTMP kinase [Candidatus Midichloriaceae bacterium]|jgi:dTMP kinase